MTGTQIAPMESFMEKVKQKLRDDIGSLLPDDALQAMVQKVVNDEFFEKRKLPTKGYNDAPQYANSKFQNMVFEGVEPLIKEQVAKILEDRKDEIEKQVREAINEGVLKIALQALDTTVSQVIANSFNAYNVESAINNLMMRR